MLGGLSASSGSRSIARFQTRKTGLLLAYLALNLERTHPRDELVERFWPEADPEAGRTSLRTALASLRRQLEPPGVPRGSVLRTDRGSASLNPEAVITDVGDFESALEAAVVAQDEDERTKALSRAVDVYRGDLLPGYYDDWVDAARNRLAESYISALRRLIRELAKRREFERGIEYALRAVAADPLREESHRDLIGLYAAVGQPSVALQRFHDLERLLRQDLDAEPSGRTKELAERIERDLGHGTVTASRSETTIAPSDLDSEPQDRRGRIPIPLTRFFGRDDELHWLESLLAESSSVRLLTLTGAGGSGKTRLSVEAARRAASGFDGGVWFIPLADISDARLIPGELLDSMGLSRTTADPIAQVEEALGDRRSLLVLDNFEQVAAGGAPFVQKLMERIPNLQCLVTSRRRLMIPGEREVPVAPLPTPESPGEPEDLMEFPSVQLFTDRAQTVRPDFQITRGNSEAVANLCRRLEGIPLAIELAAARAQAMTPGQMLDRLAQRFELLATRRGDKDSRHRSLWAAIDWSYDLLTPELQRLLCRLSVFRGGWTVEAAEAVCEQPAALEYLAQLRERSLILGEDSAGEIRFRMLDSIREYAAEQLGESELGDLVEHHAEFFLAMGETGEPELKGPSAREWLERFEMEHDNLRAAHDAMSGAGETEMALRFPGALWRFWEQHGHLVEGYERTLRALALPARKAKPGIRARALVTAGILAQGNSKPVDAAEHYRAALAIHRLEGNAVGVCAALSNLAIIAYDAGDFELSRALNEESLEAARQGGNRWQIRLVLNNLANAVRELGQLERAGELLEETLAIAREIGDAASIAMAIGNIGTLARDRGDYETARLRQEESLAIRRELGDRPGTGDSLTLLGEAALRLGDIAAAAQAHAEAAEIWGEMRYERGMLEALEGLAEVLAAAGKSIQSATLFGAAESARAVSGYVLQRQQVPQYEKRLGELEIGLGKAAFEEAKSRGDEMTLRGALDSALEWARGLRYSAHR